MLQKIRKRSSTPHGPREMMMSGRSSSSICQFTAAQWQELQLQALFFKFMVSGHPIPPELILSISGERSLTIQSQHNGWTWFQMGKLDPEPTRCRRTDGKKWRCQRQVSKDSKYCERHMHRGKSCCPRKPVKISTSMVESRPQSAAMAFNHIHLSNTHNSKPVKDPNFMRILRTDWDQSPPNLNQQGLLCDDDGVKLKRQRVMYQFIEESPQEKRDSWLNLVI